jgi:hypothetical protein
MAQMGRPGLSRQQKQELWARWKAGQSLSDIGRSLGKHAGSIFGRSACRPKPCRLALNRSLQMVVAQADSWSPQQISGWLKMEYVNDPPMRVSHETIYKCLFVQARGVLRKELISHLRTRRLMRRGKSSTTVDSRAAQSLTQYPSESGLLR